MDPYASTNPLIENTVLGSKYLNPDYLFNKGVYFLSYIFNGGTINIIYMILSIFSIFFLGVIIYVTIRMFEIREKEHKHLHHEIAEYAHNQKLKEVEKESSGVFKNEKWKKVLDYAFSNNENDWKLAIIEADAMLFDLLVQLGFKGESLGDKLKSINFEKFKGLDTAWEVHNIRNKIAHEGSAFTLSSHETKRVISLYEQIFQEFGFI